MGAVESLDNCCADRSEEKSNKKYMGSWRAPMKKAQKIDLNRDCGNGAPICEDPLKDLKLDKSIDAELSTVFKQVGHRFPMPFHGQPQLMKVLEGFKRRGYSFAGTDDRLCARIWSMHHCSRITILQFRAWFHAEVVVSEHNLRTLLSHSRWFSAMVKRVHSESELEGSSMMESVCNVVNSMRNFLEENLISSADVQKALSQVMERSGKINYHVLNSRGTILMEDFEALMLELLVKMYCDYFDASCYSTEEEELTTKQTPRVKHLPGSSACCLPTSEAGINNWLRVSESLPVVPAQKSKVISGSAAALSSASIPERSLKFPIGAAAA